jgi:MFS family permease
MVQDPRLRLTETRYGLMLSMSSLPNFFVPLIGGVFLDKRGHRFATLVFLFLILAGQVRACLAGHALAKRHRRAGSLGRFVLSVVVCNAPPNEAADFC